MPTVDELLHAAVGGVGGTERPGQVEMARAVAHAIESGEHLLVQAGTGTGKSLAYLVPAVRHAMETGTPTVVATATLALQAQVVDRDMPRLADSLEPLLGRRPTYALVKGRRNYLCAHKLEGGFPDDEEGLFDVGEVDRAASRLGQEVVRLREWAEVTESGDRDELVPGVSERAWRQVSVSAHECMGSKCPMIADCFVEKSREAAKECDVIVTNHSFMAIDAFEGRQLLPEHDLLVVDEGHELVDRVTSTITDELTAGSVRAAARRAGRQADASETLDDAATLLESVLEPMPEGRLDGIPDALAMALARVRDTARTVQSGLKGAPGEEPDGARQVARAAVDDVYETACRVLEERDLDVSWVSKDPRRGPVLRVAPMSVAMLVRDRVFEERTVVKFRPRPFHPDYLSELEGSTAFGRALEPVPFRATSLGPDLLLIRPPIPEWGAMVAEGKDFMLQAWWIATMPGLAIVYTGTALALIGDGLARRLGERHRTLV